MDIDSPIYGVELPAEFHTGEGGVHPSGYNDDWDDFFTDNPDATKSEILDFLQEQRDDYDDLYGHGKPAKRRYPREWFRKDPRRWGGALTQLGAAIGALGTLMSGAQYASAACGGCNKEFDAAKIQMDRLHRSPGALNCQDTATALYSLMKCIGVEDSPNAMQLKRTFAETCSKLP